MSRKKRAIEKQKKQQSHEARKKAQKKAYYASNEAKKQWDAKKLLKHQNQLIKREKEGIPANCPLLTWQKPSEENCQSCELKCTYSTPK